MTLEGVRLLELHSSVSVASGMSHQEYQTAVSYSSDKTKADTSVAVAVLVRNLRIYAKRRSSK